MTDCNIPEPLTGWVEDEFTNVFIIFAQSVVKKSL